MNDFISKSKNIYDKKWCNQFNTFLTDLLKREKELNKELSRLDRKRQECLHFLELEGQNAAVRARVTKILTDTSKARRLVKEELHDIQGVKTRCGGTKKIKETVSREYSYSEEFIQEVFGKGE